MESGMQERGPHILIVDDHRDLRDALHRYLSGNGMRVSEAASASAARRLLGQKHIDLAVLDIMMPGEDGLSLCRSLREGRRTPVIFLSAKSEDIDRIIGLEVGADDYLVKPFNPRELLARINAVLRRVHELPPGQKQAAGLKTRFGQFILNGAQREIAGPDGVVISLSSTEYALLTVFLEYPRAVLTRDQLLERIKGRNAGEVFDRSIDTQISRLRRKLEEDPKNPKLIKTSWGAGYVFACDVEAL